MKVRIFKIFKSIPLRLILVIPFVIQIFGAVGLVGYLSFQNGSNAVSTLTYQVMSETSSRVQQHLDSYLALPHQINELNVDAIKKGYFDIQDLKAAGRYFWRQAKTFKDISWIGYALPNGTSVGSGTWYNGKDVVTNETSNGKDNGYFTDSQGNYVKQVYETEYNPITDEWYTSTVKAGKPIWSRIYVSENYNNYVAASANHPVYDKNNQLIAVVGIDLLLSKINDFLSGLKVTKNSKVFIIERNGLLIANSSNNPVFTKINHKIKRLDAIENSNLIIRSTAKYLQQNFSTLNDIKEKYKSEFKCNQEKYFVHVTPWQDSYGLDWLVIVVLPKSDFMAQIYANTFTTILLCIAALIIAVVIGIYTSHWIIEPIQRLTKASFAITSGDLNQIVYPSRLHEINILAKSFNRMAIQLQGAFNELEETNANLENRVLERTTKLQNTLHELQTTQAQLIQTEKMSSLGQMIAGIAHEINNPVSFIYGNIAYAKEYTQALLQILQLYQEQFPDIPVHIQEEIQNIELEFIRKDLIKTLESIQLGSERISQIILSLRNFSRLDEADFKKVNIHAGIDSTLMILEHKLKPQHNRPQIEIIKQYSNLPLIECYPGQLNQVFMNLLANAIDALSEGKIAQPQIIITTEIIPDRKIKICFTDNGVGIPKEIQDKLFDPFFTTKPPGKGTGLGLSISYQIITEKHQGTIECVSKLDIGTTFIICIPYEK